jgi:LPS export ABC transporter protein LptC
MSARKKKIIFIQSILLITAVLLLYIFYYNDNENKIEKVEIDNKKIEELSENNFFENVEYKGLDASGNRYLLESQIASFDNKKPELVNMEGMKAIFYFKDGKILRVSGNNGIYNNKTNDMQFRNDVKVTQADNQIIADNLDYFNSKGLINIYGNVEGKSLDGNFTSDILNINIENQSIDFLMNNNNQVKINLKK